jgi:hypothetical protein
MVDINWVGYINILQIIVFTPEIDNGAPGAVNRHYKCRHIIATLDANVAVDYLRDIYVHLRGHSQVEGIWRGDASGCCILLGQEAQDDIVLVAKLNKNELLFEMVISPVILL